MKPYTVNMTELAEQDLGEIVNYIANEIREPLTAQKLIGTIREAVMSLAEMPTRQALVTDKKLALLGIRKLPVQNYLVFYDVSEEEELVTVIRILYGRRDWEHLL